ncbi:MULTISPECIES: hypothetical protein [unclassified Rhizobium]|uniref:hypothetical protein n=1 Tax=unclassified Rhizobium TaxID=2613769 RepID=UPI0013C41FF7|nr:MULTISPECIES: hypothetical protein [unclassified Rhizobium]
MRQNGSAFHGIAEPLYLFVFSQFRTENRYALFLELLYLFVFSQFRTENRYALFLELL